MRRRIVEVLNERSLRWVNRVCWLVLLAVGAVSYFQDGLPTSSPVYWVALCGVATVTGVRRLRRQVERREWLDSLPPPKQMA